MAVHPNSLANLKSYQPGESGNPGGKPKGASIVGPWLRELAKNPDEDGFGEGARAYAAELNRRILAGENCDSFFKAMDRTDGTLKSQIEHSQAPPIEPLKIEGATDGEMAAMRRLANGSDSNTGA